MKLAVLNPGGNDPEQQFADFAGAPEEKAHAPVNFHGFAACTGGGFYRKDQAIPAESKQVLLVLRQDLKACRQAIIELRSVGKTVAISLKEAGSFQVAKLLGDRGRLKLFREICARAHGAIATTADMVPVYLGAGARAVELIPTPYPIEDKRWDFSVPMEQRQGIFIGTREFWTESRNHLAVLLAVKQLAESMQEPVTVFNVDGWSGRRMLAELGYSEGMLRVIEGRRSYPKYLEILARHKLVLQFDASAVPGQVAGDALLCRVPCVGGNGTTEQLVFPEICGIGRSFEQLVHMMGRLLEHPHDVEFIVENSHKLAAEQLSFARGRERLGEFFERIGS